MLGEKRNIFIFLLSFVALFWVAEASASRIPSREDLLSVVPGSASFRHEIRPLDIYIMMDGQDRQIGVAFMTSQIPPEVKGYGGEIDALVGMDNEGGITGVRILGHYETTEHMHRITDSGFLNGFIGKAHDDSFDDINAITGATITCQAIIDDVKSAAKQVMSQFGNDAKALSESRGFAIGSAVGPLLVAILMVLAVASAMMPARRYLRVVTLVLSVPALGFFLNTPITIGSLIDIRNLHLSWSARLPLTMLVIFAALSCLSRGNLYCSYLCPFGALQTGAGALGLPKICPSSGVEKAARWLRWIVAIMAIYAIAGLGSQAFRLVEPFAMCFSPALERMVLFQAALIIIGSLFVRRIWCRFFCPTGLVLDIVALLGSKIRFRFKKLMEGRRDK